MLKEEKEAVGEKMWWRGQGILENKSKMCKILLSKILELESDYEQLGMAGE